MDGLLLLASIVEELAPPAKRQRTVRTTASDAAHMDQCDELQSGVGLLGTSGPQQQVASICVGSLCEWGGAHVDVSDDADSGSSSSDDEQSPSLNLTKTCNNDFPGFYVQPVQLCSRS
mmetsp:Transcript_27550/g.70162  ORF Transcript_27550/g.70162 Transcript_27550/m.70162 type:complete len:118 (-) Transcript_27550:1084-1437(-)